MYVRFGNLDFVVTMEGELVQVPTAVQPFHSTDLDAIVETLVELQLHTSEAHTLRSDQLLGFNYRRLVSQLGTLLGPQPSWEDQRRLIFSFANVLM